MKCPKCQFENPDGAKFCNKCGNGLAINCAKCGNLNPPGSEFCNECGHTLAEGLEAEKLAPEPEGERKQVTVLFSDLSGYTAMSEKLDPEELKEITSRIFGEISQIVTTYEGFIEKFIGDAVVALFGVPKAHEDDPIRAIRAAKEIHSLVEAMSPQLGEKTGQPLRMHTGINTGLVVTGEVHPEKGTHGVSGETLNLASRLSGLARPGEIVVGSVTYSQAEGYFTFEGLGRTKVKGKAELIQAYRVLSPKEEPSKIRRLQGLRADLIGRKAEMAQLAEAVQWLREGKGTIISIYGDAGTGKSRLVEEFKDTLDLKGIQWREGHAYPYSQSIPYFPVIDLMNRAFRIEEGDLPDRIGKKIESGIAYLVEKREDVVPYIGSLYSLSYPEIEGVSPEFWKSRLQEAILIILTALTQRAPTIVCFEDLHWADPSTLELLHFLLSEFRYPVLFLCLYRPPFSLFTSDQLRGLGKAYREIQLQDLSPSDALNMTESLLRTETIPLELRRFIQEKVEGNPFYVEEGINSLIESGTLANENGTWRLTRSISESDIPSTIHGVISARLDRLEKETKWILQEASVIGRAFLYKILKKITELKEHIDQSLGGLERLDLIRTRSLQPDLEYVFKHALTQEVVYKGLLKKKRREIHERIGLVMEQLFQDRLPEFSETLAFHFKRGQSLHKAVDYLVKSGEKSLKRYAVEESHQYFKEAFDLLANKSDKTKEEEELLIDLLIKWSMIFYYRGDFRGLEDLLIVHENLAESLGDKARLGMFYAWLAFAWCCRGKVRDSYQYLCKALRIGEKIGDQQVIGYACAWLTWTCSELGLLEEAIVFGKRAQEIARLLESDQYLYFKSMAGLARAYWDKGETKKALEAGNAVLDYGQRHYNIRSLVMGHYVMGFGHFLKGDLPSAIECCKTAIQVSADPFYSQLPKALLGGIYLLSGQFKEAEKPLQEIVTFSKEFGCENLGSPAHMLLGVVSIAKGRMGQGLKMLGDAQRAFLKNQNRVSYAQSEYLLGKVYLEIVGGAAPISLTSMAKNIGFLIRNIPFASQKAEDHFNKAINVSKEIGATGILGQAYLDLGLLHKAKGKKDKARECISEAVNLFEQCQAEVYLKQAKEALQQLG